MKLRRSNRFDFGGKSDLSAMCSLAVDDRNVRIKNLSYGKKDIMDVLKGKIK